MAPALDDGPLLVRGSAKDVLDRLISPDFVNFVVGKKLNKELVERLKIAILSADALAADAKQKPFGNKRVREWLDSLRDAPYTVDDLLDRALNLFDRMVVTEMEDVIERIEDLERCKDILSLRVVHKGTVFGRHDDKWALMKMLNDNNDHKLSVISIVGKARIGKTTVAQCLYNNQDLMEGFDLKAWIRVFKNFDVVKTTKDVIKGINAGDCSLDDLDLLQQDLKKRLSEKKFFIVLDDGCSEDDDKWKIFITPFQDGRKGSTLLLTTQNVNVGPKVQIVTLTFSMDYQMITAGLFLQPMHPFLNQMGAQSWKKWVK